MALKSGFKCKKKMGKGRTMRRTAAFALAGMMTAGLAVSAFSAGLDAQDMVPVCGLEEHVHTEDCYPMPAEEPDEEPAEVPDEKPEDDEFIEDEDISIGQHAQSAEELATLRPKKIENERHEKSLNRKSRNDMDRLLSQYDTVEE